LEREFELSDYFVVVVGIGNGGSSRVSVELFIVAEK